MATNVSGKIALRALAACFRSFAHLGWQTRLQYEVESEDLAHFCCKNGFQFVVDSFKLWPLWADKLDSNMKLIRNSLPIFAGKMVFNLRLICLSFAHLGWQTRFQYEVDSQGRAHFCWKNGFRFVVDLLGATWVLQWPSKVLSNSDFGLPQTLPDPPRRDFGVLFGINLLYKNVKHVSFLWVFMYLVQSL